jgi:uncharacterized protein GlcG (DUF336 family)
MMNRPVLAGLAVSILAPMCVLAQIPADSQPSVPAATQAPGAQTPVGSQPPVPVRVADAAPVLAAAQAPAAAQTPAPAARGPSLKLALEAAQKAVDTCKGLDQKVGVTVVDSAGVLKVVLATDGASTRGVASSTNKALTALAFTAPTSELGEKIKSNPALADKIAANPNYNTRAGGVLLKVGDDVIGAIGVGGAKGSEKDEACALAGREKVKRRLK